MMALTLNMLKRNFKLYQCELGVFNQYYFIFPSVSCHVKHQCIYFHSLNHNYHSFIVKYHLFLIVFTKNAEKAKVMLFFFILSGFSSQPFTNHRTAEERGGNFFNSSLPLPPASQTLRHQPGDYCRKLTSAHR